MRMRTQKIMKCSVGAAALALLCAGRVDSAQVLYTADGDTVNATDRLKDDGAQDGAFMRTWTNNVKSATSDVFVTNHVAKFGTHAYWFNSTANYLNTIDIQGSPRWGRPSRWRRMCVRLTPPPRFVCLARTTAPEEW